MILAIDAGNTQLTMGAFAPGKPGAAPLQTWRCATHPVHTGIELKARISQELEKSGKTFESFETIVLATVVPAISQALAAVLPGLLVVDWTWPFSFQIATADPSRTGIDRLVNAEAAFRQWGAPAIIVDAGTATTIDALMIKDGRPVFAGGAILPGLEILRDALSARTAQLPRVNLETPSRVIGRDTDEAIRSGLVLGYASLLEGMILRFKAEFPQTSPNAPTVSATGGVFRYFKPPHQVELDFDLTLKGIIHLYESLRNRQSETHS